MFPFDRDEEDEWPEYGVDTRYPWVNVDFEVAHPDSPLGAGGAGRFKSARGWVDTPGFQAVAHPDSPAARKTTFFSHHEESLKAKKKRPPAKAPPPPTPISQADLVKKIEEYAKDAVGKPTVHNTTPEGKDPECTELVERIYKKLDAQAVRVPKGQTSGDADYIWGDEVKNLADVKPGDVLQFNNHKMEFDETLVTKVGGAAPTTGTRTFKKIRPHHTAIVISVDGAGEFTVAEQHLTDPDTGGKFQNVVKNKIFANSGTQTTQEVKEVFDPFTNTSEKTTITITSKRTVTGTFKAYRPKPKVTPPP